MAEPQILHPPKPAHRLWYCLGLAALAANKIRHAVRAYRTPRPFWPDDVVAAAEYDQRVFDNWLAHLRDSLGRPYELAGKRVCELGPGADLGVVALALAAGAAEYVAFDRFPLVRATPPDVHERILSAVLRRAGVPEGKAEGVRRCVADGLAGRPGPLRYVWREDFDLAAAELGTADLIVSQAAVEHLDDPARAITQLAPLAKPGAVFLAVVDLQTHTALLRRRDPLNIYRYSPRLYRRLRFAGAPNRARPGEYVRWLTEAGWSDVRVRPTLVLPAEYTQDVRDHLAPPFRTRDAQMEYLTVVLCAVWPRGRGKGLSRTGGHTKMPPKR